MICGYCLFPVRINESFAFSLLSLMSVDLHTDHRRDKIDRGVRIVRSVKL